ncbi:stage II sporulation protein M [Acidobacteriota bacterium]
MSLTQFLESRQPAWDRLEFLLFKCNGKGVSALTEKELHELTRLYPAVAVDVARARIYKMDAKTQRRINRLAIAAHGLLYRRKYVRPLPAVQSFFAREYPRLFRRMWLYMTLATTLFLVGALGAYTAILLRPSRVHLFVPGAIELPDGESGLSSEDITERFRQMPKPPMAAGIMVNNISVAFNAFALGITAGIGTCYVILVNAMMLGAFAACFASHGLSFPFWSTIAPHGCLEIFAILISASAGLRLGISLVIPGKVTRKASLKEGAREAVFLVLGTIPMFFIAGIIEGFVTPSYLPGEAKIVVGVLVLGVVLAYLLICGREKPQPGSTRSS